PAQVGAAHPPHPGRGGAVRRRAEPAGHPHPLRGPRDQPAGQPGLPVLPAQAWRTMIPSPKLDDREFDDTVAEALRLIPRYAPERTHHNPRDPGIPAIALAAWVSAPSP